MPFERPTLQTIINRVVGDLNTQVDNSKTFLRRSVFLIMARVVGGVAHLLYGFLDFMKDQLFVSTADAEFLTIHGSELAKPKREGEYATGSGSLTGTTGTVIEAGSKLQSETGNLYSIDSDVTVSGGVATIAFTADEVGDGHNESAGVVLSFVSPVDYINTEVTVDSSGITGGTDQETDDEYRARLLSRKRQPPHGGADFDYVNWMLEVSGVTRAWCIPLYQGVGTIGLAFVRDNGDEVIPTETQRLAVYNYILSHTDPTTGSDIGIPVTATPGCFMIPLSKKVVNYNILIYPNTSVVQASITSRLQDLFKTEGGPSKTITISQMYEAIVSAVGEVKSKIVSPSDDEAASVSQVHYLGDITFGDYS